MAKSKGEKLRAVDDALQAMFKDLESRPTPNTIRSVVDQLGTGQAQPAPRKGRRGG